ncbi:NAD-binding protein [Paracoccus sp. S1E-3]|uniref:NAD-binding protein n=2 Tax=Paracoccus TaxID=265 RepID=UPI001C68F3AE|nr:NAD-binding protein [Paracoccus sp. S1E-3]
MATEGLGPVIGPAAPVMAAAVVAVRLFRRLGPGPMLVHFAAGVLVSILDSDPDRIREAEKWGARFYFGDCARLDVLRHSSAEEAEVIMVCVDDPKVATQIASLLIHEFPQAKVLVRAHDRGHAIELIHADVDYQIRETVESALASGRRVYAPLAVPNWLCRKGGRTSAAAIPNGLICRCRAISWPVATDIWPLPSPSR